MSLGVGPGSGTAPGSSRSGRRSWRASTSRAASRPTARPPPIPVPPRRPSAQAPPREGAVPARPREGGGGEREALRALGEMIEAHPDNLALLLDRARLAARAGDAATLADTVARLGKLSAAWPPRAQEMLRALEQAAGGNNPRLAAT